MMPTPDSSNTCTAHFADRHIHGIAGVDFATSNVSDIRAALDLLRSRRTPRVTASIPAVHRTDIAPILSRLGPLVVSGELTGVHLEGPFLAPEFAGAHPRQTLVSPTTQDGQALLATVLEQQLATRAITMMTVAPELPGFERLAGTLVDAGITPALGHTGSTAAEMQKGINTVFNLTGQPVTITHLYNAMRGFHHRDPGPLLPIMEAVAQGRAVVELIADGHHVDMALINWWLTEYPTSVRLVSDASAATLLADQAPISNAQPRLGLVTLQYNGQNGPRLAAGQTLASGGKDLLAIHDDLVRAGFDHASVCASMRPV